MKVVLVFKELIYVQLSINLSSIDINVKIASIKCHNHGSNSDPSYVNFQ
jgi:hypothetical protein